MAVVNEVEPNNSVGAAQAIASLPATVNGSIGSNTDDDYFKLSIAAGKKLNVALTVASSSSGFGLGVYLTATQPLGQILASPGQTVTFTIGNSGATAVTVALRVSRSSGGTGAYKLNLAP